MKKASGKEFIEWACSIAIDTLRAGVDVMPLWLRCGYDSSVGPFLDARVMCTVTVPVFPPTKMDGFDV